MINMCKDHIIKEIARLRESFETFETILEEQKEEFGKFVSNASYKQINNLENCNEYSNLLKTSRLITDVDSRIKCLEWALKS